MKISIFYKFFSIIFIAFTLFQYINIKVDYKTNINYQIKLLENQRDTQDTQQFIAYMEENKLSYDEFIQTFEDHYQHQGHDFHILVSYNQGLSSRGLFNQIESECIETDNYHNEAILYEDYYQACLSKIQNQYPIDNERLYMPKENQYFEYGDGIIVYNVSYVASMDDEGLITDHANWIETELKNNPNSGYYYTTGNEDYLVYDFYYIDTLTLKKDVIDNLIEAKMPVYKALFVLSFFVSLLLSKMLTCRIKEISDATTKISKQDFDVYLKANSHDEIGILSTNINTMSKKLKETMENLNQEIETVKHLEGVRKEFIANFTHEIKTPIAIINGYIELLEKTEDEEKKKAYLESINKETHQITKLVMAMLDLSQLEARNKMLNYSEMDIEESLAEMIDRYLPLMKKKGIMLEMEMDHGLLMADETEMNKVFKNLLSNAVKHTKEKGKIFISYENQCFSIENEGNHLSEEELKVIFETYVSSDRDGTGLGLAICKAIFELHGFTYGVENTERGVKFYFNTENKQG